MAELLKRKPKFLEAVPSAIPTPEPEIQIPPEPIPEPIKVGEEALPPKQIPKKEEEPLKPLVKEKEVALNPRQKELLEKLKIIKKITRKEYAQQFDISIPTAARDLKDLVDKKLLTARGPLGPGRWYELV